MLSMILTLRLCILFLVPFGQLEHAKDVVRVLQMDVLQESVTLFSDHLVLVGLRVWLETLI